MKKNKVKELRLSQHLSQEQLAEKANVSVRTVQRLENGKDVSISTLNLVAKALRVSVDDLLFEPDPDKQQEKLQEQEDKRYTEFHTFKMFYSNIYVVVMLLIYMFISILSISDNVYSILEILWIGGWMVMVPIRRWLIVNKVNPKLDQKYPLTVD